LLELDEHIAAAEPGVGEFRFESESFIEGN
jgi:hypothetical protein